MRQQRGFTVIELLIAIAFLAFAGTLFFMQKRDIETANRDYERKTAINAMYYNLEEVYYAAHKSYPRTISPENLTAMDPALFTDPDGIAINDQGSDYRYEPSGCEGDACGGYVLRADLEAEADYTKSARR